VRLVKYKIFDNDTFVYVCSSIVAGTVTSYAINPIDCASTRVYNQKYDHGKGTTYNGLIDCIMKTIRKEGITGLYKGVTAQMCRLIPQTILVFFFLENLKKKFRKMGYI